MLTRPIRQPASRSSSKVDGAASSTVASRFAVIARRSWVARSTCASVGVPPTRSATVRIVLARSPKAPVKRSYEAALKAASNASGSTPSTAAISWLTAVRSPSEPPGTNVLNRSKITARRMW